MYFNSLKEKYSRLFKKIKFPRYRLKNLESDYFSSVFICGGDREKYNSRIILTNAFSRNKTLKLIVCEDLKELMGDLNLFVFEKILADISKMILIPVESYGTACEIGAFTYISKDDNKVVAIINEKYLNKGFIGTGPVAFLESLGSDRVIKAKYEGEYKLISNENIENLGNHNLLKTSKCNKNIFNLPKDINEERMVIVDSYYTFFVFLIDFCCFFKRINSRIVIDYIKTVYKVDHVRIKDDSTEKMTINVIECMIRLIKEFGYVVEERDGFYNLNKEYVKIGLYPDKYTSGRILFTNDEKDNGLMKLLSEAALISEDDGEYR